MDPRRYSAFVALSASALLILAGLLVSGIVPFSTPGNRLGSWPVSSEATNNFDQLVVVLMENKNLNEVYGPAPYMTQLADQYSFSQGWSSITNPSQPNYIAIMGASTFGVGGDGNHPNLNHPTLVDLIETSGHTWNAIAEGSGSGCSINPDRGEDHFPFLSYTTITGNAARCANLHSGGPADVVTALNAGTNFIWFTPTDNHNMHDNSVSSGDAWIQSWVPGLLTAMAGKKAALILMFDEAYTSPPYIYMSFSGPATKLAYKSTASYSHYSLAKLLEDVWGGGSLGQGDVSAPSPLEFFGAGGPPVPDFSIAANPGTVSFIAGQSATSTVSLTASGGFTGTVGLAAASVPVGATTACVPASISGTQTSTCTITGTNAGSYAVTITGTSGALVHTAPVAVTITPPPPTAPLLYSPSVPSVNDTITFDATSSTHSDPSATLQAPRDWESDGTWDTTLSSSLTAQHAFAASGRYTGKMEIQDSHGFSDTDSRVITVFASGGGGVGAPPGYGLTNPSLLQAHGPIYIGSDAQFTAANGVRSGTGTITDPYVISNWFIDGNLYTTTQAMIWIEGTSSYVVIENVRIANLAGANQWEAFQLGHWPATIGTQHGRERDGGRHHLRELRRHDRRMEPRLHGLPRLEVRRGRLSARHRDRMVLERHPGRRERDPHVPLGDPSRLGPGSHRLEHDLRCRLRDLRARQRGVAGHQHRGGDDLRHNVLDRRDHPDPPPHGLPRHRGRPRTRNHEDGPHAGHLRHLSGGDERDLYVVRQVPQPLGHRWRLDCLRHGQHRSFSESAGLVDRLAGESRRDQPLGSDRVVPTPERRRGRVRRLRLHSEHDVQRDAGEQRRHQPNPQCAIHPGRRAHVHDSDVDAVDIRRLPGQCERHHPARDDVQRLRQQRGEPLVHVPGHRHVDRDG